MGCKEPKHDPNPSLAESASFRFCDEMGIRIPVKSFHTLPPLAKWERMYQ